MVTPKKRFWTASRRAWKDTRGAEILEMAFVLPILMMLLMGIFWMGRAYNVYESITRAAREGARYAVLPSCATCGNAITDTYSSTNSCLSNPTPVFTNHVLPALQASSLVDPTSLAGGSYCEEAVVLDPNADPSVQQCGVSVNITYPVQMAIPFTSLNATTINISTQVRMRFENQSVDTVTGNLQCPGVN